MTAKTRTAVDLAAVEARFNDAKACADAPKTDPRVRALYMAMALLFEQQHRQERERREALALYAAARHGLSPSQRRRLKPPKLERPR